MYLLFTEWLLGQKCRQAAPVANDPDIIPPFEKRLTAVAHLRRRIVSMTSPIYPTEVTAC